MSILHATNSLVDNRSRINLSPAKNKDEFESRLPDIFKYATPNEFNQFKNSNQDLYNKWYEKSCNLPGNPLTTALKLKNIALARFFVDTGVICSREALNYSAMDDITPLQLAVQTGDISIIKKLKDLGADFRVKDSYCDTNMMHFAALSGSIEVVELVRTWPYLEGFTGRHSSIVPEAFWAAQSGNIECLLHLLKNPPDTRPLTIPRTPCWWENLHGEDCSWMFYSNGETDPLKFHCEEGTILHYAAKGGSITIASYLVNECKVPLLLRNHFAAYAIHIAASKGDVEMVKFLWPLYKKSGMGIDDLDANGTLLFRAVRTGSLPLTQFLVNEGASKFKGNACGKYTSVSEIVNYPEYKFKEIKNYIMATSTP